VRSLDGAEDREGRAHARHQLAQLQLQSGDVDAAETTLQDALWELEGPGWARARSAVQLQLASVWMARQDPERALGVARQALEGARGAQHRPAEIDAIQHIGVILAAKGDLHPACRALEDALVGRELLKDVDGKISVLRELGPLEVALGRVEEGVGRLLRASELLAEQDALRPALATAQVAMSLAEDAGHREAALTAAQGMVGLASRTGDPEAVAAATFLLATRLAGAGQLDEAAARFGEAHAAQAALGLKHDAAVSLGMLGQVRVARGEHAAGRAALAESHAELAALGSEAAATVREILDELTAAGAAQGS
jgi:tetratricopeptide (TPR) repeat protein